MHFSRLRRYRSLGHYGRASFGALPEKTELIPINNPGPPIDQGDAIFGISRGWHDGLQPGSFFVADFEARYAKAKQLSEATEADYKVGTPVRTLQAQLDRKLVDALQRVNTYYKWDRLCTAENNEFTNCRSVGQANNLMAALGDTNAVLNEYSKLEAALAKAPPDWRNDYVPPYNPPPSVTTTPTPSTYVTAPPVTTVERKTVSTEYRSTVGRDEKPLWQKLAMYGVPAVLALGVVGSLLIKKKPAAVAGYRRRK